ncbi:MAG: membrane protein insertase YidC [Streptosporangiaceae bacterium]
MTTHVLASLFNRSHGFTIGALSWLYQAVTWIILRIHTGLSFVFDPNSGAAWGLSIVLLVVLLRIVLFPLFVKQFRSTRKMQELQPQVKALQQKYKNDKQRLNQEVMQLYRESGANPLGGCLPLIAQAPIFYSLFTVLRHIAYQQTTDWGLTAHIVHSAAHAKILGAPIAAHFLSPAHTVIALGATPWVVKAVALAMVIITGTTTFVTQRQTMKRQAAQTGGAGITQQQKMMLYALPPVFAAFGLGFPIGVLIYWVTNNGFTMAQQFFLLRRMMPKTEGGGGQPGTGRGGASPAPGGDGGGPLSRKRHTPAPAQPPVKVVRQQPARRPRSKRGGGRKR